MKAWTKFWRAFDMARIVPRVSLAFYGWLAYDLHRWFKDQPDISTAQTIYISVVWGAIPLLLRFYMENGPKWSPPEASAGGWTYVSPMAQRAAATTEVNVSTTGPAKGSAPVQADDGRP